MELYDNVTIYKSLNASIDIQCNFNDKEFIFCEPRIQKKKYNNIIKQFQNIFLTQSCFIF